jgi:hypothetical protein
VTPHILRRNNLDLWLYINEAFLTGAHNFVFQDSLLERNYALGFLRVQLPGSHGVVDPNVNLVEMPIIGNEGSLLVIYHQGSYLGYLSVAIMIPQTQTSIVVLTNSLAFNDAADWIGQLLLENVLDAEHPTDFVMLASQSRDAYVRGFVEVESNISTRKDPNAPMKALDSYCGDYYYELHNFFIGVFERMVGYTCAFKAKIGIYTVLTRMVRMYFRGGNLARSRLSAVGGRLRVLNTCSSLRPAAMGMLTKSLGLWILLSVR